MHMLAHVKLNQFQEILIATRIFSPERIVSLLLSFLYVRLTYFNDTSILLALVLQLSSLFNDVLPRGTNDSTGNSGGGLQTRVLSTFLNELDGVVSHDYGEEGAVHILSCEVLTVLLCYAWYLRRPVIGIAGFNRPTV